MDGRSDLYALGVILFKSLTGAIPYGGDTPLSIVFKHLHEPIPKVRAINPDLPVDIQGVIDKAMAKEASDRYTTAAEFIAALESVTDNPEVQERKHAATEVIAAPAHKSQDKTGPSEKLGEEASQPAKRPALKQKPEIASEFPAEEVSVEKAATNAQAAEEPSTFFKKNARIIGIVGAIAAVVIILIISQQNLNQDGATNTDGDLGEVSTLPTLTLVDTIAPTSITTPKPQVVSANFAQSDEFNEAIEITTSPFNHSQEITNASSAQDDPILPCVSEFLTQQKFQTVWYKFIPSVDGIITISTQGSSYQVVASVWDGSKGSLRNLQCSGVEYFDVDLIKYTTYYIEFAAWDQPAADTRILWVEIIFIPEE